jgi:aspartate kinase
MKDMKIIVMKFGGTSVGDAQARALMLEHIIREVEDGFKVLVVVSAMGRL